MAATETVARFAPYIEQLLEDESARRDLLRGADKLREGANEMLRGAQKPKKRRGRLLLKMLPLAAIGAGVAIALSRRSKESPS